MPLAELLFRPSSAKEGMKSTTASLRLLLGGVGVHEFWLLCKRLWNVVATGELQKHFFCSAGPTDPCSWNSVSKVKTKSERHFKPIFQVFILIYLMDKACFVKASSFNVVKVHWPLCSG